MPEMDQGPIQTCPALTCPAQSGVAILLLLPLTSAQVCAAQLLTLLLQAVLCTSATPVSSCQ